MKRFCSALLAVAALAALPSAAGASAALDAALTCRKGITKMGEYYTHKRRVLLLNCIDKLLKCEVQKEVDGTNPNSCRSKAETSCQNTLGSASTTPLSVAADKFDSKAGGFCAAAAVDFANTVMSAVTGLKYANDPECGLSADLPSLLDCLREQLAMSVDDNVGTLKPRAGILLDNAGLGANFPDIPRPPTTDVPISRTMAGNTGTLINPSPIMIASGTALRFSGDAATLSCGGMGNNARLTITILPFGSLCSDPTLQDLSIKEPFTAGNTVTAGPFTSDLTFCLHFKDGGSGTCDETISGTIDVP